MVICKQIYFMKKKKYPNLFNAWNVGLQDFLVANISTGNCIFHGPGHFERRLRRYHRGGRCVERRKRGRKFANNTAAESLESIRNVGQSIRSYLPY